MKLNLWTRWDLKIKPGGGKERETGRWEIEEGFLERKMSKG